MNSGSKEVRMDAAAIKTFLRDIGIEREIVALKQVEALPTGLAAYNDKNNICYMFGEVMEEKKVFYTTLDDHVCLLGCAATGLDPHLQKMSDGVREESRKFHVSAVNIFPDEAIQEKAEREADILFPKFENSSRALIMGPFGSFAEPDVLIIVCGAEQVHLLTRAYCYARGTFVRGYAGMGACRMLLPFAFINREPTYTVSDRTWRKALKLAPDELTLVTPADKLEVMVEYLEMVK
jgi:uncharacterized protein (DUF169 family)